MTPRGRGRAQGAQPDPAPQPAGAAAGEPADRRPRGRVEVREALLDSAQRLFAERGPANVPLRDIAVDAGVNFGLVYKYLGARDDLLRAVYQRVAGRAVATFEPMEHLADAIGHMMSHPDLSLGRVMAWAALEGDYPGDVFGPSPALERVAAIVGREAEAAGHPMADDDARLLAAVLMVTAMAWRLLRPIGLTSAGLDPSEDGDRDRTVTDWVQRCAAAIVQGRI
jgi:AcrR family transcriptional regulator